MLTFSSIPSNSKEDALLPRQFSLGEDKTEWKQGHHLIYTRSFLS